MATPAQAAAATVGAGSLAAAGAYGITQAVNGSGEEQTTEESENQQNNSVPTPEATFTNDDVSKAPYTGKLISIFKVTNLPYLVKSEGNEEWWKWAFENKFSKNKQGKGLDTLFTSVDDSVKLKEACKNAYKSETSKYSFAQNEHLLKNISDYCTKGEATFDISEPKVVVYGGTTTPTGGYENGLLKIQKNRDRLVKHKTTNPEQSNEYWWKWVFKNKLTEKAKETATDNFKNLTLAYKSDDETGTTITALNNRCNDSYKKAYADLKVTDQTKNLLNDIKRFCSIDPENTVLELPEPSSGTLLTKSSNSYSNNKLIEANESKLVDPANNQDWWEWMFNTNFPKLENKRNELPDPFKHVTSGHSASEGSDNNQPALNQACKKAYSKDKNTFSTTENLLSTVKKFCTPTSVTDDLAEPKT